VEADMPSVESPQFAPGESVDLEELFQQLATQWRKDTAHFSSQTQMANHPAYQQIISLGPAVLPFIFRELARKRDFWFYALTAITGDDPIAAEDAGKVRRMADAWLAYGRERGYLPDA